MTFPTVVYYVSGHGFGHARRSAAIMQALVTARPDIQIIARTSAPANIFANILRVRVVPPAIPLDFGAAERDAMSIDVPATLRGAAAILESRDAIIAAELPILRSAAAVVADIPFIIGDVLAAHRRSAGPLPAFAAGNFTWDWIYEPYIASFPQFAALIPAIKNAYAHFGVYLRYPFSHDTANFPRVIDVPLIIHAPDLSPADAAKKIGIEGDPRPRVLMAMRGGLPDSLLAAVARESPDFLFLALQPLPPNSPENLRHISASIDFTDLISACDIAITKLGYGIIADAIACGTRLVWPARENFREDTIFRPQLPRFIRQQEIPRDDLRAGRWRTSLQSVMQAPPPPEKRPINGAEICAALIASSLA